MGHSFGGAVACWLAAHAAERVSALVLAAPSANAASLYRVDRWLAAPLGGPIASAVCLAATGLALHPHRARRRLALRLGVDESYLEESGRVLLTRWAWRSFVTEQRVLVSELPALEPRLGDISVPTAIVVGTEDRVVAPRARASAGRRDTGRPALAGARSGASAPAARPRSIGRTHPRSHRTAGSTVRPA